MIESFTNIVDLFFDAAGKYPNKIAIIEKENKVSFSELERQVQETSLYFTQKGIQKGDLVMVFVPMSIDLYRIVLALFNIGATAVFLDEWVSKSRMEECLKVAKCKAFIGIYKIRLLAFFSSELRNIPIKLGLKYKVPQSYYKSKIEVYQSDIALITFTTGSMGLPKAAKRTHGFLFEQFSALVEVIDPRPEEIDMTALPIVLLINLGVGCTSVIPEFKASKPESMKAAKIFNQLKTHKVNRIISSPFFIKRLSKYMLANNLSIPELKKVFTGGGPVFANEAKLYSDAFPKAKIEIVYGSTEAEPISSINVKDLLAQEIEIFDKGLCVGIPYNKTEVRIIGLKTVPIECSDSKEFQKLILPPFQIGEIIVSGSHVLKEYYNNRELLKQNKIFVGQDCWHRTGDSGYLDNEGKLYLTGRCTTLIFTEEQIIAPFIYENYFQSIHGIEIGTIMAHDHKIFAMIELKKDGLKSTILHQLQSQPLKLDEIKFLKKIPRDLRHNSKIDYEKLRIMLGNK